MCIDHMETEAAFARCRAYHCWTQCRTNSHTDTHTHRMYVNVWFSNSDRKFLNYAAIIIFDLARYTGYTL